MLKKEVTGNSELHSGAVPTHFIWTVEPHQSLPHSEWLPVCSTLQGSYQGWQHQHQEKHPFLFFGTSATEWQSLMSRQGTHLLCWAQENRCLFLLHTQSRQGQTALPVGFSTQNGSCMWPEDHKGPFREDMDPSVHTDPPCHPPARTCYVGWWAQAKRAWHGKWRRHESQAAYGRCSPSNAHWSSTSFSGHIIERGKEKGREEMRRKAQKLFTH